MSSHGKIKWKGISVKEYTYEIFSKSSTFSPDQEGNYIFAKQTITGWDAVYIGQGDLATRTQDKAHLDCVNNKGFSHYHVHINNSEIDRKHEEEDMIEGNLECLSENGGDVTRLLLVK